MGKAFIIHNLSFSLNNLGIVTFITDTDQKENLGDSLAWSANSLNVTDNNPTFPTLINTHNVSVTYSSTNTSVATINSSGVVTILSDGITTIKATFDGDDTYNAKEVSYTLNVHISSEVDYSDMYFTIESLSDNNTISMDKTGPGVTLSYSTDNGSTWTEVNVVTSSTTFTTINNGDKILFKGVNDKFATQWNAYDAFVGSQNFIVYGNVMSLLWGDDFTNNSEFKSGTSYNLCGLFQNTTTLIDASNLILPALICTSNCYNGMFKGCTNLTTAPELPATQSAGDCYSSMFEGCINLEEAPDLNLVDLSSACCQRMFCMSRDVKLTTPKMTKSPVLSVTISQTNCYKEMFKGNGNLVEVTCLLSSPSNTENWLLNCSDTGTFYKATNASWETGTSGIPSGWTTANYGGSQSNLEDLGNSLAWSANSLSVTDNNPIYPTLTNTNNVSVTYSSTDTSVATIDSSGAITILGNGQTTIKATFAGDNTYSAKEVSYTMTVSVLSDLGNSLAWSANSLSVTDNNPTYPTLTNTHNVSVTYSSTDTSVATIDSSGAITILGNGQTIIKATFAGDSTYSAKEVTYTLTVQIGIDYSTQYFTIESLEDDNTITMAKSGPGITLSYSMDNGSTWTEVSIVSSTTTFATINTGDKILFKGVNDKLANAYNAYDAFRGTKYFKAYGNVMSLLWGDDFTSNSEFKSGTTFNLCGLFYESYYLTDASNLILPATICTSDCYNGIFRGCTHLEVGPELPATQSAQNCYSSMFEGCINLEEAPEINLVNMSSSCCKRMFCMHRSSKLTTPKMTKSPILRVATGVSNCYEEMFKGNGNLIEITCLMTTFNSATNNWLVNCSDTGTFYKDANASWASGTSGIPTGWTSVDYVENS